MKIWIMKGKRGEVVISTSREEIKPYIYVIPQENKWIEILLGEATPYANGLIDEFLEDLYTIGGDIPDMLDNSMNLIIEKWEARKNED